VYKIIPTLLAVMFEVNRLVMIKARMQIGIICIIQVDSVETLLNCWLADEEYKKTMYSLVVFK